MQEAADPHLRQRGHWDWQHSEVYYILHRALGIPKIVVSILSDGNQFRRQIIRTDPLGFIWC